MRLFLDTTILLDYLLDSREAFHEPAVKLMIAIAAGDHEGGFATSQATDLYSSLNKACNDGVARSVLQKLFAFCDLYATSPDACVSALQSSMRDYEDAVQMETARENGCDYIVTRSAKDYAASPIPFIDAAGFLALAMPK